jgi:hypothetical protein
VEARWQVHGERQLRSPKYVCVDHHRATNFNSLNRLTNSKPEATSSTSVYQYGSRDTLKALRRSWLAHQFGVCFSKRSRRLQPVLSVACQVAARPAAGPNSAHLGAQAEDGKIATPVPRACCMAFWEEPILAEIRRCSWESGELVFLGGVWRQDRARALTGLESAICAMQRKKREWRM